MNITAVEYTSDGVIVATRSGLEENVLADMVGRDFVIAEGPVSSDTHYVNGGVLKPYPVKTSPHMVWDNLDEIWVEDLAGAKAVKWGEIKLARYGVLFGTLTYAGNVYDIDASSQQDIMGAAQLALFDSTTSVEWTLADNTSVVLTASDLIGLGVALGQHKDQAHKTARQLRAQIEAATSQAELDAIAWPE